jgi:8-oxo-dGTP diphosphatase
MSNQDVVPGHDLVAAAVIFRHRKEGVDILSARRTEPPNLRGGWELPGGRVDPGETSQEAVVREVREELGCDVEIVEFLAGPGPADTWPLTDDKVIHVYLCRVVSGEPFILEQHDAMAWLRLEAAVDAVAWLRVDIPIVEAAIERIRAIVGHG